MRAQADLVWEELFLRNTPISEACRGVLTCFQAFGLHAELKSKDLAAIRRWFDAQNPQLHLKKVFALAGVRYAVMTNIPFDDEERAHWLTSRSHDAPELLRSALRIDPLFAWDTACSVLQAAGFSADVAGAQQYLQHWAAAMGAEYLMASFNFALKFPDEEPFSAGWVLQHVVAPVARKLSLPFAIKCGTRRGANARLRQAGDGVGSFDVGVLNRLCTMFPDVKFLATILSMDNQHELAVTARKFANLHLYGCWWFCNNPSLIHSLTAMRVEMLGSAFTSQHSDSRVLEHLVYKWAHSACHNNTTLSSPLHSTTTLLLSSPLLSLPTLLSSPLPSSLCAVGRKVIAGVLTDQFQKIAQSGWPLTRSEIQRSVRQLLGGSYEEFMSKKLS